MAVVTASQVVDVGLVQELIAIECVEVDREGNEDSP